MTATNEREATERWEALNWQKVTLTKTRSGGRPFRVADAPRGPGVYRITWVGPEWSVLTGEVHQSVAGCPDRAGIRLQDLRPPVLLMVGMATRLPSRLSAQMGTNPEVNTLFLRLRSSVPEDVPSHEVRSLAQRNLLIECAQLENPTDRGMAVEYASRSLKPLFQAEGT